MTFDDYQTQSRTTAIYPPIGHAVVYPTLGLANEAGEVAGKIKKIFRDDSGQFSDERLADIKAELGDVLWYVAQVASELDLKLEEIAQGNLDKLFSRKDRGVLGGSGDQR